MLTVSVSQLNHYMKRVIEHNGYLKKICIQGEISNFKHHPSGHLYLTLKDEASVLRAVMFRAEAAGLRFVPEDGMRVAATGRISVYEPGGVYQLYIDKLEPDGEGALYQAFLRLKEKLEKEGLFDPEFKKPLPAYPSVISIVTAASGAAIRDMIHVLGRRYPLAAVKLFPVSVQGEGAAAEIASAIDFLNKKAIGDVMIIGRGGGSIEDLWAFNEEIVARAVFRSKIPVISAVGHETDFTIADFVADLRAPTPSAAAELAVPDIADIYQRLAGHKADALQHIRHKLLTLQKQLDALAQAPGFHTFPGTLSEKRITVDYLEKAAHRALTVYQEKTKRRFQLAAGKLEALSPLSNLARGYAYPSLQNGTILKSIRQIQEGDALCLRISDGEINCSAREIRPLAKP
ncbi:MAG: exodeoxyribonuclease VII large subunit [Ruminococcaceae bacterium]|nr:exodeoxyribonuclease VII large subunit [Oscillospiraceae bacterium]